MSLSRCMIYTIDSEGYVVDKFECDREIAMTDYWNRRCNKGKYLIANPGDDIKRKWKRKPLQRLKHATIHSENEE